MGSGMTAGGLPANKMVQRGDQVDYARTADTAPGTMVLLGSLFGLDSQGGLNGSMGAIAIEGVVQCPENATPVNPSVGDKVGYDFTAQTITGSGLGDANIGLVVAVTATFVWVKLLQGVA